MCGKHIATGYGQVITESSHKIRYEWCDDERCDDEEYEVNLSDNYGNDPDNVHLEDVMDKTQDMNAGNVMGDRDATDVEDVTDFGDKS
jgi:hypothetical protein